MQDNRERFAIRTVIFHVAQTRIDKGSNSNTWIMGQTVRTVVVTGRPAAVLAAEKIGKLSEQSWARMKRFVEDAPLPKTGNLTFETDEMMYAGRMQANLAMIIAVDEG